MSTIILSSSWHECISLADTYSLCWMFPPITKTNITVIHPSSLWQFHFVLLKWCDTLRRWLRTHINKLITLITPQCEINAKPLTSVHFYTTSLLHIHCTNYFQSSNKTYSFRASFSSSQLMRWKLEYPLDMITYHTHHKYQPENRKH